MCRKKETAEFEILSLHSPGRMGKTTKKLQSRHAVFGM
jgi:hypothetical protein